MSEELEWTQIGNNGYEAYTDEFHYTIHPHAGGGCIASMLSRVDGETEVKVTQYAAPTLDHAKRVAQMRELQRQLQKKSAERVKVYFHGYVEYEVDDTKKVVDAVGFGGAHGSADVMTPGALERHILYVFKNERFAIDGANVSDLQVGTSLRNRQRNDAWEPARPDGPAKDDRGLGASRDTLPSAVGSVDQPPSSA